MSKLIQFDKQYIYYNNQLNKKNVTFFFYNKKSHLINNNNFNKPGNYQNWSYLCSRIYGLNKRLINYLIPFLGYNKNVLFTNIDEYYFLFFKHFLKNNSSYFSLSWYVLYLKQRTSLLPLLIKGIRFLKKLPSRGQRTRSNYNTSKKMNKKISYSSFKKKLNKRNLNIRFPNWKQIESFYFHRF